MSATQLQISSEMDMVTHITSCRKFLTTGWKVETSMYNTPMVNPRPQ